MDLPEQAPAKDFPISPSLASHPPLRIVAGAFYLVDIDGDVNDDVQQVSQSQAGYQDIRAIAHALVLVNNSQQCGVSDDAQHEH